ncbi:cobalt ECF transporter T component CbiQ [Salsipaludibacter albus]|uniref:cobalt ECF transporter T component CbiQ n=1 Tax=Salsipaludibacter albus TaxID=2849650 RepID=UPI001EE3DD7D|nr:cobalt ECF transporter T component CbiQ [Salsipaludibacter albus]
MGVRHSHPLHVHGHSVVHHLAPHVKIVATVVFAVAVAVAPPTAPWAFVGLAVLMGVALVASRLPPAFVATRVLVVVPFVVFGLLVPFVSSGHDMAWGPVTWSSVGARTGLAIAVRSVLGVTASIVLAGTTELPRLLGGLDRLRVPPTITAIASFMLRYLEVVAAEFGRMRAAMTARGHDPRWLWQVRPLATASGALFVRSYERGERVHLAMQSRGFTGTMPRLHDDAATPGMWALAGAWAAAAVAVVVVALVVAA